MLSTLKIPTVLALTLTLSAQVWAMNPYSKNAGEVYRKLPEVKKGGTLFLRQASNPQALVPFLNHSSEYKDLLPLVFARLMQIDFETNEYFPMLAEKLEVSKDHKSMTYTLRANATWDDGSPITADDAEFTYNTIMDKKVDAAPLRAYIEAYHFEKIDARTFKFTVEKPNVSSVNEINDDFLIIQKKQFAGVANLNSGKGILSPMTSGPYRIKSFSRDQKLEFERRKDWWGYQIPEFKNQFNFDLLVWRIISDSSLAYEKLVRGEIDILGTNAELYGTRIRGIDKDKFGTDSKTDKAMWADHFKTKMPAQWTYLGWNNKKPIFQSKKTRQALAMLINYDEIVDKVWHGEGIRCLSPFGTSTPNTAPNQKAKAFSFDPAHGLTLLKEDGWADLDHDNVLAKMIDGKKVRFEFTLKYNSDNLMRAKAAQMIKEQFKKAGIVVNIQAPEFNVLSDAMDKRDFDAIIMGWGNGMLNADSKQIWHTASYENKGSNAIGYSNPEVDQLIDQASTEVDVIKHFALNQKIGAMIYDDQPVAFLLEVPGFMAAFQTRKVFSKKWVMKYDTQPPVGIYSAP